MHKLAMDTIRLPSVKCDTYEEQVNQHVAHMCGEGFELRNDDFLRAIGSANGTTHITGRGERLWFKSNERKMNGGWVGLGTVYRVAHNQSKFVFATYSPDVSRPQASMTHLGAVISSVSDDKDAEAFRRMARGYLANASTSGASAYLISKGVGNYGVYFWSKGGRQAVVLVPVVSHSGELVGLQRLFPDGVKRFLDGSSFSGGFHVLNELVNGKPIGIAESYVTAATCYELTGVACVCAFGATNLPSVVAHFANKYPASKIIVFADNDRHAPSNIGLTWAQKAAVQCGSRVLVVIPDFGSVPPAKDASDWSDMVRIFGRDATKDKLFKNISITAL
jgi:hypothetical protein